MKKAWGYHASSVWLHALTRIFQEGVDVSPRGMKTLEIPQATYSVNMNNPVVTVPSRKLGYSFLAAEALWILAGDDRVETIAPYSKDISKFSDDGRRFFGAYGPKIMDQFPWVLEKLFEDRDTRQAGLTIWREKPPKTKDVPCTVAIFFSIRKGRLHCHVFMRSSDAWLGLPYDIFNFSMIAAKMACEFNLRRPADTVELGYLHLTAASSHLYERNFESARLCLEEGEAPAGEMVPTDRILHGEWNAIEAALLACRDKDPDIDRFSPLWRIRP